MSARLGPNASTLPVGPLLAAAHARAAGIDPRCARDGATAVAVPDRLLGEVLGVQRSAVTKLRSRGSVNAWTADRYATRLGLHPAEVWGNDWWSVPDRVVA